MKHKDILIIVIIIMALVAGSMVYWFSLSTKEKLEQKNRKITELNEEITQLNGQISKVISDNEKLETEVDELQKEITKLEQDSTEKKKKESNKGENNKQPKEENYIDVVFPDGGETFCLGKKAAVQWKCSENIETVSISIYKPIEGAKRIETVPAHEGGGSSVSGTYLWEVGETARFGTVEPDNTYRMQISSNDVVEGTEPRFVYDQGEGIFTIEKCEE